MNIYSQRDNTWKDVPLGTSKTTTIGSHGCTITCVAMLAQITPKQVNERLMAVSGYAKTNLIIWGKIHEAIPWLDFEWRGYTYTADDNAKVKDAIEKYGGVIVEVDGAPIGGTRHWVLYVGNRRLYDPWDGQEKATSTYPTAYGYSVIRTINPPVLEDDCEVEKQALRAEADLNWNVHTMLMDAVGVPADPNDKEGSVRSAIKSLEQIKARSAKYSESERQVTTLKEAYEEQISTLKDQLTEKRKVVKTVCSDAPENVTPYIEQLEAKEDLITELSEKVKRLEVSRVKGAFCTKIGRWLRLCR